MPPPGELFRETNDNSVAILLSYGTARVLLAGDAEAMEEEYVACPTGRTHPAIPCGPSYDRWRHPCVLR